ncbi:hypothetical protein MIR68_000056 [Amoeboaphelidium protococcarum]|nr:hypothetical protein MIR68_000056 [Amoeboaphelidium protococcarum]
MDIATFLRIHFNVDIDENAVGIKDFVVFNFCRDLKICCDLSEICTWNDLLDQVIYYSLRERQKNNILSLGCKLSILGDVVTLKFNSTAMFVRRHAGLCELFQRVGARLMFIILSHCQLMLKLQNGNYVQLSGVPFKTPSQQQQQQQQLVASARQDSAVAIDQSQILGELDGFQLPLIDSSSLSDIDDQSTAETMSHTSDMIIDICDDTKSCMVLADAKAKTVPPNSFSSTHLNYRLNVRKDLMYRGKFYHGRYQRTIDLSNMKKFLTIVFPQESFAKSGKWRLKAYGQVFTKARQKLRKLPLLLLLKQYCPAQSSSGGLTLNDYSRPHDVKQFVRCVLIKVFSCNFFGGMENLNAFVDNAVGMLLNLRKFESMPEASFFVKGIKSSKIMWLRSKLNTQPKVVNKLEHQKLQQLCSSLFQWLLNRFVSDLLKACFFITDTSHCKNRVFYYRFDLWRRMNEAQSSIKNLHAIGMGQINTGRKFMSQIRLIPKENGSFRRINNLRSVNNNNNKQMYGLLSDAQCILLSEKNYGQIDLLKEIVLSNDDIYARLKQFKMRNKARLQRGDQLYFVKSDVTSAYDSINRQKLFCVLEQVFRQDSEFIIHGYQRQLQLCLLRQFRKLYHKVSIRAEQHQTFPEFCKELAKTIANKVFIDKVQQKKVSGADIFKAIEQLIYDNILQFEDEYYVQEEGIPQGSIVSSLLCSLLYSHLALDELFTFTRRSDSLLIKFIDDFLYLTFDKALAQGYLSRIQIGFPDYGVYMNPQKTGTNCLDMDEHSSTLQEVSFCGHIIQVGDLNVSIDMNRYFGSNLSDTLSVNYDQNPGDRAFDKLVQYVRPKSLCIYFDCSLNGVQTVAMNIFENMLIIGLKILIYVRCLNRTSGQRNEKFMCTQLWKVQIAAVSIILGRVQSPVARRNSCTFYLKEYDIKWLCLKAFRAAWLRQKASLPAVVEQLETWLVDLQDQNQDLKLDLLQMVAWIVTRKNILDQIILK